MTAAASLAPPLPAPARYRAYGLRIASDIPLPELAATEPAGPAELAIRRCARLDLPPEAQQAAAWHRFAPEGAAFRWAGVGAFAVSASGARIDAAPAPGVGHGLVAFPLLGPVLAEALRRQGLLVLHASAVEIGGAGVALLADKGTGKSTAAAALLGRGARLLADDLTALRPGAWEIPPGFAQLKLSPGALAAQRPPGARTRRSVHAAIGKRRVLLPGLLAPRPVPVRRLYVLTRGDAAAPAIAPLPPEAALPALLRFVYASRFGRAAVDGAAAATLFRQATALAGRGLLRRLALPEGLDRLAALHAAITRDLAGDAP
ncbi:MAG: serine kinase [Rhodobacteraceae bacterium]|nr:serine kinase [Paracoccaceae bacterium]